MESGQILNVGIPVVDPLEPGQYGTLSIPLFDRWRDADVLCVEATDPHGRLIQRWSWPVKSASDISGELLETGTPDRITVFETDQRIILESGGVSIEVSKKDGKLERVISGGDVIPLSNGPHFRSDKIQLEAFRHYGTEANHHLIADFGRFGTLEWVMHEGGIVDMNLQYQPEDIRIPFTGASFAYPEETIKSVRYLGNGPYRVWKNRMAGTTFNVWEKPYNNTITGHSGFEYPEFKGYYSNLYWARFTDQKNHHFTVYSHSEDLFLRLFTPEEAPEPARTAVSHPPGDLSFMLGIPAIGTKFKDAEQLGPQSKEYQYRHRWVKDGNLSISLSFDFRQSQSPDSLTP
jgi:hypothetical protein